MYTGFGQDPRRETGLSVVYRFDFFGRTHEKKYIYIYVWTLTWVSIQQVWKFLKYQWWGIYDDFCVGFFDWTIRDRGDSGCPGRAKKMNTSSIDLSLAQLTWMIPAPKTYTSSNKNSMLHKRTHQIISSYKMDNWIINILEVLIWLLLCEKTSKIISITIFNPLSNSLIFTLNF